MAGKITPSSNTTPVIRVKHPSVDVTIIIVHNGAFVELDGAAEGLQNVLALKLEWITTACFLERAFELCAEVGATLNEKVLSFFEGTHSGKSHSAAVLLTATLDTMPKVEKPFTREPLSLDYLALYKAGIVTSHAVQYKRVAATRYVTENSRTFRYPEGAVLELM